MFYDGELRFLENILRKCHLQTARLDPEKPLAKEFPYVVRYAEQGKTFYDLFPDIRPHTIYHITDASLCRYIVLQLPFCDTDTLLFIGPYLTADITHNEILELAEKLKLSPQKAAALEHLFTALPVVKDGHHILAMVSSFADFLWNGDDGYGYTEILADDPVGVLDRHASPQSDEDAGLRQLQAVEQRYAYESEMLLAVAQGNLSKIEMMIGGFSSLAFEERVPDRLRNLKNYCIVSNTLFRKAAQDGGVHPIYIDRLSSRMARKIESILSLSEIPQCMAELARSYCRLVKEHAGKRYTPVVQKAVIKIENDLAGDLSLRAVAAELNVSAAYLSGLFKKETGETLTAFVTEKRIAHAKRLLRSTSLQIQTIAQHCGILDLHYFCRVFKERTGETPSAYRARHA
ncbi:MAG: helix-turn-helix domain-containing protein [Clostridia bacterium]|nr:helix-turn-helix domain-containing protein [Clostridia bacterium]